MFGQMKSRRRTFTPPCNHTNCGCFCHNSETSAYKEQRRIEWESDKRFLWKFVIGLVIFMIVGSLLVGQCEPSKRYIEVNGNMCEVQFKRTGSTSTGGVIGHDIAVCK